MNITGLSSAEVQKRRNLGLSNDKIDTYSPTYLKIIRRNIFTLMNIVIIPLIGILTYFNLYREVTVFSIFVAVNIVVATFDEVRTKKKLEKLKEEFQTTATVIRDSKQSSVPISEIVQGDFVVAKEGEGIVADGKVVSEKYLQVDESILTGESNYVKKDVGEKVLSGSFVVTGECVYEVEDVGKSNYINKVGAESLAYTDHKSPLEKASNSFLIFFVTAAIVISFINFFAAKMGGAPIEDRILALTSIVAMTIPQTLIVLFTLTFTISVVKLSNKGILVQKGSSIEELAAINVVCVDKTGTITTNKMKLIEKKYLNLSDSEVGGFYNSIASQIAARNKTQELLDEIYSNQPSVEVTEFDQIPFTSKIKYSLVQGKVGDKYKRLIFGAPSVLDTQIADELRKEVDDYVEKQEKKGYRILMGLYYESSERLEIRDWNSPHPQPLSIRDGEGGRSEARPGEADQSSLITNHLVIYTIEETLNPGIKDIIAKLKSQEIDLKIISGDSMNSVKRIAQKIGFTTDQMVDLSNTSEPLEKLALQKTIFTRAKPEDKVRIITALQNAGQKVAMIGDGINDVVSLKKSNVGIAMESGAKITRDIADIVLLNNDYQKIPEVFYEGDNIIFNLKFATKIFFWKAIIVVVLGLVFSVLKKPFPMWPSSTLVFSFLGNSLPSYLIAFSRQNVINKIKFTKEVVSSAVPAGLFIGILDLIVYYFANNKGYSPRALNTSLVYAMLSFSLVYLFFLLKHSGKVKNLIVITASYALLTTIGITQTFLPITSYDTLAPKLILVGMLAAGVITVRILAIVGYGKKQGPVLKWFLNSMFIWGVPLGSFFPFRTYYVIEPIPIFIYGVIAVLTVVAIIGMIAIHKFVEKIVLKQELSRAY